VRALLALTDSAVEAVRMIMSSTDEDGAAGVRVRAERNGGQTRFLLSVAAMPAEDDAVVEDHGARVFLDTRAASLLDEKVLDARIDEHQVAFEIDDQM
jgi:Fe-S cluster assembly iron-binding protein IscA